MTDVLQISFYISAILLVFPIGFSVILLSKKQQENWIPKSYLYGTAILIIGAYWISYFNEKGLRGPSRYFVALALMGAMAIVILRRNVFCMYVKNISRADVCNFLICGILGSLSLLMTVLYGAIFPYCDGYTYICNADYLMDYGYRIDVNPQDTILHPWLSETRKYQNAHFRIGTQMFLALFSSLFNVKFSLEMFMPITAYGVFLCGMAAWMFASRKYTGSCYYKTIAIILVVLNVPIILWNAVYGFMPQTFGSAFFMAAVATISQFEDWKNDSVWSICSAALLFACSALSYNEMLPFLVLVTGVLIIRYFIINKIERKQTIVYMICCAIVAVVLIITFVSGMIESTLSQFGAVVGWHQDKDIYTYIAYFLSTVPAEYNFRSMPYSMTLLFFELLTVVLGSVVVIGFYKSKRIVKKEYIYASLPYALVMLYFMVFSNNPFIGGRGNSWSIYKLMQYYFVMAIPYIAICMSEIVNKMRKIFGIIVIAMFVMLNVGNAVSYMEELSSDMEDYVGKESDSIQEYYKLYECYGESGQRIILYDVPHKHRQMITYFLKDVELVSDWQTDGYFAIIPEVSPALYDNGISLRYDLSNANHVAGLVECEAAIEIGEGFYEQETLGNDYWNWSSKESKLSLLKYGSQEEYELYFEVFAMETEKVETIMVCSEKGERLSLIQVKPNELTQVKINISAETEEIYFQYSGEVKTLETDPRELAFAIRNYNLRLIAE
uniref:hypothetical protein n=1 Tax=Acetatifactor sp. TaxID=1872090 RepID=UPI0040573CBF